MAGVQKVRLNNLNINIKNALIVGIIIAKNSPRTVGSKKKNGESRGVTSFTIRDSEIDTINVDVWGSEYFVLTFYERFLIGDVVEVTSPKICVKTADNETYRPQVTSPFYLSLNEGMSDVSIHGGDAFSMYLPLLHIPTKQSSAYYGLAEVLKLPDENQNVYVDLLVVVKSVKPAKNIKTRTGLDMSVRGVEIMDNTTPASLNLDIFDVDTIQRAEEWRPLESVLFIADARVSWRARAVSVQACARSVITHQPHTADAEALRLHVRNQATAPDGSAAAWAAWSGAGAGAASVAQVRERAAAPAAPFCAALHALLTHLDLDDIDTIENNTEDIRVRFADHTGELTARLPINVLEETLGYSNQQLKSMSADNRAAARWAILLEQCSVKLAASPPRLLVLSLRRATQADPIPLY
ncbi:meiosis-specific with OB domain-containing protein [Trichoplusia ni]|uniref:Meiosis-specific with OB domain-containing protein n=1 Tax=Trichoplusia ni TaxID=7111 RepID=A0A7E5VTH9_TRINI|nr:meiosis-specific with OB domain-containing protein [Trichoplusia ni]